MKTIKLAVIFIALQLSISLSAQAKEGLTRLSENVYEYHEAFYGSLVLVTKQGILITDPANTQRATKLKKAIAGISSQPVKMVILTHEHYDHVGGTEVFDQAKIVCHAVCESVFRLDITGRVPDHVDIAYTDSLKRIDFGGEKVELHHLGAADGVATTIVYLPEHDIAASADMYEHKEITAGLWMDDSNSLGTRKVLNKMVSWNLNYAINAHTAGASVIDLKEGAQFHNDLFDAVNPQIQAAMGKGFLAVLEQMESLPNTVKLPAYKSWKNYQDLPVHVRRMALSIYHGG